MTNGSPSMVLTGTGGAMVVFDDVMVAESLGALRVQATTGKFNNITKIM